MCGQYLARQLTIPFSMADSVKEDLKWLRANEIVRGELRNNARGFLFDIKTGKPQEIKA